MKSPNFCGGPRSLWGYREVRLPILEAVVDVEVVGVKVVVC